MVVSYALAGLQVVVSWIPAFAGFLMSGYLMSGEVKNSFPLVTGLLTSFAILTWGLVQFLLIDISRNIRRTRRTNEKIVAFLANPPDREAQERERKAAKADQIAAEDARRRDEDARYKVERAARLKAEEEARRRREEARQGRAQLDQD